MLFVLVFAVFLCWSLLFIFLVFVLVMVDCCCLVRDLLHCDWFTGLLCFAALFCLGVFGCLAFGLVLFDCFCLLFGFAFV